MRPLDLVDHLLFTNGLKPTSDCNNSGPTRSPGRGGFVHSLLHGRQELRCLAKSRTQLRAAQSGAYRVSRLVRSARAKPSGAP